MSVARKAIFLPLSSSAICSTPSLIGYAWPLPGGPHCVTGRITRGRRGYRAGMARIRRAPPGPPPDEDPTAPIGTRAVETETVVPPPPPEAPPPREIWPWLLALVLVALAIIGAVLLLTHRGSSTKRVPDVVGLSGRHAVRRLSADGFRSRIAAVNSSKPKDIVIAQAPQAGAKLSKGGTVALTVSAGPAKVVVPSVTGSTVASAIQRIHAAHLVSRQIPVFAAKAKGTVVSQKPAAG